MFYYFSSIRTVSLPSRASLGVQSDSSQQHAQSDNSGIHPVALTQPHHRLIHFASFFLPLHFVHQGTGGMSGVHLAEVMDSVGAQRCICKNCYRAPTAERKSKLFKRLAMCAFINIICYFPTVGPRSPTVCVYAVQYYRYYSILP